MCVFAFVFMFDHKKMSASKSNMLIITAHLSHL